MLCLGGFELYPRWVPLTESAIGLDSREAFLLRHLPIIMKHARLQSNLFRVELF